MTVKNGSPVGEVDWCLKPIDLQSMNGLKDGAPVDESRIDLKSIITIKIGI